MFGNDLSSGRKILLQLDEMARKADDVLRFSKANRNLYISVDSSSHVEVSRDDRDKLQRNPLNLNLLDHGENDDPILEEPEMFNYYENIRENM
jgi:hypothetical protein